MKLLASCTPYGHSFGARDGTSCLEDQYVTEGRVGFVCPGVAALRVQVMGEIHNRRLEQILEFSGSKTNPRAREIGIVKEAMSRARRSDGHRRPESRREDVPGGDSHALVETTKENAEKVRRLADSNT